MPTIEPVRGFTVPTVAGDVGVWGGEINTTINEEAAILGSQVTFNSSTVGSNTTVTSSQAQNARLLVFNTSSSPFQLNLPSSNFGNGPYIVGYISSQFQALTVTGGSSVGGAGTTAVISGTSSGINRTIYSDGLGNVFFSDPQPVTTASSTPLSISSAVLSFFQPAITTQQFLTPVSSTYFPTSTAVQRIRVRMSAAGAGGAGATANNGSSGGNTAFGAWTCIGGAGGIANGGDGGVGGTGGVNGVGTLIARITGGQGGPGQSGGVGVTVAGGTGGANPFGGSGAGGSAQNGPGFAGSTNTGAGGGGGTVAQGFTGSGGGAGECVEFWVTAPSSGGIAYTLGAGGAGGAAGGSSGGAGAAGRLIIEEFYI